MASSLPELAGRFLTKDLGGERFGQIAVGSERESPLAVGKKQTRAGWRFESDRMSSSSNGLSGSIEKPPPPIATICPLAA